MKISAFSAAIVAVTVITLAGCGGGTQFGKELSIAEPTSIAAILKSPDQFNGKRVLVEGRITEVCEMMGCWIMIQEAEGTEALRFKVDDGVITFPMDIKGKIARAEGVVSVKELSEDEQIAEGEHHADETGTTFDASTVSGPKMRVQLNGEGALVK
jgi:hypothetical protein